MKNYVGLVFTLFLLVATNTPSFSTHIKGGEITVEKISPFTMKIVVTGYRDRTGVEWGSGILDFGDGTEVQLTVPDWSKMNINTETEVNTYVTTHTYAGSGEYIVGYTELNRNAGILNVNDAGSVDIPFYIQSKIILSSADISNASARFLSPAVFTARLNSDFSHTITAFDPEEVGVLQFSLIPCLQRKGVAVPQYEFPDDIQIDRNSGLIAWAPSKVGTYNFNVKVTKYVEGQNMGYTMRDFQVVVLEAAGEEEMEMIDEEKLNFIGADSLLVEPGDSIAIRMIFSNELAEQQDLELISELLNTFPYAQEYGSFSVKDSGEYKVGTFIFEPGADLKRKTPYLVTFRGSAFVAEGTFYRDKTVAIYTELPEYQDFEEENIITSIQKDDIKRTGVYPNPASQYIKIEDALPGDRVEFFNVVGKFLGDYILQNGIETPVNHLKQGTYIYKIWRKEMLLDSGKLIVDNN